MASISAALIASWLGGAPYSLEASHLVAVAGEQYPSLIALGLLTGLLGIGHWSPAWVRSELRSGHPIAIRLALPPAAAMLIEVDTSSSSQSSA